MRRFFSFLFYLSLFYFMVILLVSPIKTVAAGQSAIQLCLNVVIPSLFPFLLCSRLLLSLGVAGFLSRIASPLMRPLFGVPGSGALAVVLGIISGYPIGASTIAGLYRSGHLTKTEAHRLLSFCNNAGPLFVMGAIGIGILGNQKSGLLLYLSHILSALAVGILFRYWGKNFHTDAHMLPPSQQKINLFAAVGNAVADGVDNILKICGFVILFAVFTAGLPDLSFTPFLYGCFEITGGISAIFNANLIPPDFLLPTISFFLALSGICVLFQTAAIIQPTGLSLKPYLLGKLLQGIFSFFLTLLFCRFFHTSIPATLHKNLWLHPAPTQLFAIATSAALFFALFLFFLWLITFLHKKRLHQ